MKEEINLLPPAFKKEHRQRLYVSRIGRLLRRLDSGLLLTGVMFLGFYLILDRAQADILRKQEITQYGDKNVELEIRRANEMIRIVQTRAVAREAWTPRIYELLQLLPPPVRLTSLTADPKAQTLTVQGTFVDRAAIVQFENQVKQLPWVEKVEAPLKNFATGTRSEFTLILTRKETKP